MKRLLHIGMLLALITTLGACSTGYRYYTAGHDELNLQQYKSFAFAPRVMPRRPDGAIADKKALGARLNYVNNNRYYNNPEAMQKIKAATEASLQSKGLTLQEGNADLLVRYSTLVDRGTRTTYYTPYYGGFYGWGLGYGWGRYRFNPYWYGGWGGGYGYGGYPSQEHFKEGVLAIELIDARTKEPVWIGYGSGELSRDPKKVITQLPKIVEDIFKRLPVAKS